MHDTFKTTMTNIRPTRDGHFYVAIFIGGAMGDLFDEAAHVARFEAKEDAIALRDRIVAKYFATPNCWNGLIDVINTAHWQGPTSKAATYQWDAKTPEYIVPATKF